jgi:hypothetical protein
MLARVVPFGRKHSKLFPKDDLTGSTFATTGEELSKIAEHAATEVAIRAAGRTAGTVRTAAREALRTPFARIVQTAAAISMDVPGPPQLSRGSARGCAVTRLDEGCW